MKEISSIRGMRTWSVGEKALDRTIAFVPTMGFLHEGHVRLLRWARRRCGRVVVSIFVNPLQFGPREDFRQYPRDVRRDLRLLRRERVDCVFVPKSDAIYPDDFETYVEPGSLSQGLCGTARPGHFRGVVTVVLKLFQIVQPDVAVFGQKDYQQFLVIRQMVKDLHLGIRIIAVPIVREPDGLAMSSRNVYLTPSQRSHAVVLYQALQDVKKRIWAGEKRIAHIRHCLRKKIQSVPEAKIDYLAVVDAEALKPCACLGSRKILVALAVYFGQTRLIDNVVIHT